MYGPINVKSPNNTSKWQMGFNSAFKGLNFFYLMLQEARLPQVIYWCSRQCSRRNSGLRTSLNAEFYVIVRVKYFLIIDDYFQTIMMNNKIKEVHTPGIHEYKKGLLYKNRHILSSFV
jgi:hypothetical protein